MLKILKDILSYMAIILGVMTATFSVPMTVVILYHDISNIALLIIVTTWITFLAALALSILDYKDRNIKG